MGSLRVVGYVRCSTQEQATEGMSLEAQGERLRAWCDLHSATLLSTHIDAGVSGTRPLADRVGGAYINGLLSERNPAADAVTVVRLDRLGRDAAETLTLLKRFANGKLGLVSIEDRLDLSTPQGRAMAGVASVFSELERDLIGQRTSDALNALRRQGKVYGPVPFGYRASGGLLRRFDEELRVLADIQDMRDAGHSYRVIASKLNADGVVSKRGGSWSPMSVRSVLGTAAKLASA